MRRIEMFIIIVINVILILFEIGTLEACVGYLKSASYYREVFVLLKSMCLTGIVLSMFVIVKLIIRRK